ILSPDGRTVVYFATQDNSAVVEMYSVPVTGGSSPVKLNGTLVSGGAIANVIISPDSSQVVYVADQDTDGVFELYSVPIGGGTPVKLNGQLPNLSSVTVSPQISPDSSRVIYVADQDTFNVNEIYSVPIGGGTPVKLNGQLVSGGTVSTTFQISPDSSRVVYQADQDTNGVFELYSAPIGGGNSPVKLNGTLVSGGDVESNFLISANSSTVVYRADQDTDNLLEIYSAPISGGSAVKLNSTLVSGGTTLPNFQISANSTTVVYMARQENPNISELYSVPIGGGTPVKLNGTLASNRLVQGFKLTPDSSRVVYQADEAPQDADDLYSVPIGGGNAVKLTSMAKLDISPDASNFYQITPDSRTVVYRSDENTTNVFEFFSVPVTGGTVRQLNGPIVSGGTLNKSQTSFIISADSRVLVYEGDQTTDNVDEVYAVSLTGCQVATTSLNGTLSANADVRRFSVTPDGTRVVYVADQDTAGVTELYSVRVNATNPLSIYDVDTDSTISPSDSILDR
ncbi:MAG: LpqB family beta-propeller domain-containing protein, partial [Chloroflexota bacterium]